MALLRDPLLNKGTAFSEKERDAFGLRGLLPAHVLSMQAQAERVMTNLRQFDRSCRCDVKPRLRRHATRITLNATQWGVPACGRALKRFDALLKIAGFDRLHVSLNQAR